MRRMRCADTITTLMGRVSGNVGASASWNPQGLSRPVMGLLYLYLYLIHFLPVFRTSGGNCLGKSASYAVINTICSIECSGDELMMT
jgi:hypothetical protein